ncbi:DUF2064 domain-containing protein [Frankia sp. AgPm24]|uniref:TIGR04282 family arsenosugar biosynthesis glycosyltransferase n=1 Tax=Frankia sp. AgPm24 TaxID=631128 RepID=UPI002035A731|nr:DUF2064 domain-containing protein [Frankia sp. AgPm24]
MTMTRPPGRAGTRHLPAAADRSPNPLGPPTLIVIAKEPLPGRVKTRLTPPYTPREAARFAAAALADTLDAVASASRTLGVRPLVVLDGHPGHWLPREFALRAQVDGPLDVRLAAAFDAVRGQPALLVGMDTPQITPAGLLRAAARLRRDTDAAFGRARDGGWWLLGLGAADGDLVRGVPTSRPDTGARQHTRLRDAGLRVVDLPVLRDVDTAADIAPVAALAPRGRFAAVAADLRPRPCDPAGARETA